MTATGQTQTRKGVKMAKNIARFTALLSLEDEQKLLALCALDRESKGAVLRQAIRSAYAMRVLRVPTCANGQQCYVPGMHLNVSNSGMLPAPPPPPHSQAVLT